MLDFIDLLRIGDLAGQLKQASRNRASPEPVVRGRVALLLAVAASAGLYLYVAYYAVLSSRLRSVFGVVTIGAFALALLLLGNQLDAAISRSRLAARAARKRERSLARKDRRRSRRQVGTTGERSDVRTR